MIKTLNVGDTREYTRTISQDEVMKFAEITDDFNPAHFDSEYAKTTFFKRPIVHGMLVGSLFSKIFGMEYPGKGSIYCNQSLTFLKPVYPDESLRIIITVDRIDQDKNRVYFKTEIFNEANACCLTGEAMLMPPKVKRDE